MDLFLITNREIKGIHKYNTSTRSLTEFLIFVGKCGDLRIQQKRAPAFEHVISFKLDFPVEDYRRSKKLTKN